jgi:hypothetical protein
MKGFVSEEALAEYSRLAAEKLGVDFAEGEVYDFARCMRADGSFYGTSGTCRKGSAAGDKEEEAPKTAGGKKRRATAEAKNAAAAERKAAGNAKRSATAGRARLLKEELEKVKDKMRGADSETQNRLLREAAAAADRRSREAKAPADKNQLRDTLRQSAEKAKTAARAAREADKNFRSVEKELKKDPKNKELRARYKEAIKAANDAERESKRADRENDKAARARGRQYAKEQRAKMSPAQRAEERRIDKIIKERG